MSRPLAVLACAFGLVACQPAQTAPAQDTVAKVWSSGLVGFAVTASDTHLYVGYYNPDRQLTIAQRSRKGGKWTYKVLAPRVGWDSHNGIALGVDSDGRLHVAANMHATPLIYFMSAPDGDVASLTPVRHMVDTKSEARVTYPIFLKDASGRLVFKFRSGGSGAGNEIYNVFDSKAARWTHLTAKPVIDGERKRSAYPYGPVPGPDQKFHMAWVWRDKLDAATNHDLSYAQSSDLAHWTKADGTALPLPMTFKTGEIVDPVPIRGGIINNNAIIGFDDQNRAVITYHKFDSDSFTQVYAARFEGGKWHIRQITQWNDLASDAKGRGALPANLTVEAARPAGNGLLRVPVTRKGKSSAIMIRADDLSPVEETPYTSLRDRLSGELNVPKGMTLNVVEDDACRCAIAWPSRPSNADRPYRDRTAPTDLVVVPLG